LLWKNGKVKWWGIAAALVVVAAGATIAVWAQGARKAAQAPQGPGPAVHIDAASVAAAFAEYQEIAVDVKPQVPPYKVADDLGNITNREWFQFSPDAERLLKQNGFVVVNGGSSQGGFSPEFFQLYEENRYQPIPSFITTDSMLHNYHLFFNHLLTSVEQEHLAPALKSLTAAMLQASGAQYGSLKGTAWENAARRNMAFFAVASRLLDQQAQVPEAVRDVVGQEVGLINEHAATAVSPVMNMGEAPDIIENLKEDYTQYIPRGHYDTSDDLKSYFKAMMWYGRLTFRQKNEDETRSAALMTMALSQGDNYKEWARIYEPTNFFVGKSDDITPDQYRALLTQVYGADITLQALTGDTAKWASFLEAARSLEPPQINSIPIFDENIQPDRELEIKGFRFMGQRFTVDAMIFQRLIYRDVKENQEGNRRLLPKGLDIPAALGSAEAYRLLQEYGETDYEGYPENMGKLKQYLAGLDLGTWTQNLYWSWLHTLMPVIQEKGAGYPSFMQNTSWVRKGLNAWLGSWTELKHDTILYAKQVYAEMGGGGLEDDRGYVEPDPVCYARLASLVKMTKQGLEQRGLLDSRDRDSLDRLAELALSLKTISEKELQNLPLTEDEHELIKSYGGQLEHFWLEAMRDQGIKHHSEVFDNPAALVADVATAPPDTVLEEGTGYISEIYVVVPVDGQLRIARGGIYTYYEFPWPAQDRLTDTRWREMLENGQTPELPDWTGEFRSGTGDAIYPEGH
jgi:hypothetical protein